MTRSFNRYSRTKSSDSQEPLKKVTESQKPFSRLNFILMAFCLLLIVVGFLLMSGGGSSVEGGFNPEIFSTRRIVVGPLFAFLGFLLMAFAIVISPETLQRWLNKIKGNNSKS